MHVMARAVELETTAQLFVLCAANEQKNQTHIFFKFLD